MCANRVVAGVRCSTLPLHIRSQTARQFSSAQHFNQLEGLALAIPWGFAVSPFMGNRGFVVSFALAYGVVGAFRWAMWLRFRDEPKR
jgi:hypothetical protein